jgi:hypothetical protein
MKVLNYEIGRIIQEYGDAGYPYELDDGGPFVKRLMAEGFTVEEAVTHLAEAWEIDNEVNV